MKSFTLLKNLVAVSALMAVAVVLCGCPTAEPPKPAKNPAPQEDSTKKAEKPKTAADAVPSDAAPVEKPASPQADAKPIPGDKSLAGQSLDAWAARKGGVKEEVPGSKSLTDVGEAAKPQAAVEEKKPDNGAATEEKPAKAPDLGPPLVDNIADLKKLDKDSPAWIDMANKQVVLVGETCKAEYGLEFFATLPDRGYESVVVVTTKPHIVHAALVALGAEAGHPARFDEQNKYIPPAGTEILIEVRWKDKEGKVHSAPAQQWIRNHQTKKALDANWVFGGSSFRKDDAGQEHYLADSGDFISVLTLPTAMLDLPIHGTGALESRVFEGFAEHMPPAKTPVTILLKPELAKKVEKKPEAKAETPGDAGK